MGSFTPWLGSGSLGGELDSLGLTQDLVPLPWGVHKTFIVLAFSFSSSLFVSYHSGYDGTPPTPGPVLPPDKHPAPPRQGPSSPGPGPGPTRPRPGPLWARAQLPQHLTLPSHAAISPQP